MTRSLFLSSHVTRKVLFEIEEPKEKTLRVPPWHMSAESQPMTGVSWSVRLWVKKQRREGKEGESKNVWHVCLNLRTRAYQVWELDRGIRKRKRPARPCIWLNIQSDENISVMALFLGEVPLCGQWILKVTTPWKRERDERFFIFLSFSLSCVADNFW